MDGKYLSNSRNLIDNWGYSAVLIEAEYTFYQKLQTTYASNDKVVALHQFVGFGANDNLDVILSSTPIPSDFDLLSIDIDGNDYHVWQAFSQYRPKVVIIEFNPTIPSHIPYIQDADPKVTKGSGLRAMVDLGNAKGYSLVCVNNVNAIFVDAKYFDLFGIEDNSPEALRSDENQITYLIVGYDGEIELLGNQRLPWHRMQIQQQKIQMLPRFLRAFPGNYSWLQQLYFAALLLVRNPGEFKQQFRTRVLKSNEK